MDESRRLAKAADRYYSALIQGEPVLARSVISQAFSFGASRADTYLHILAPAQARIGELWHRGAINVAQEHLATTITIEMMDFLRNGMEPGPSLGARAVVTPVEDDQHFIGARMVADFLAMDGWDVDFLGTGTPAADLAEFVRSRDADLVALSVTLPEYLTNAAAAAEAVRQLRPDRPRILLGGNALDPLRTRPERPRMRRSRPRHPRRHKTSAPSHRTGRAQAHPRRTTRPAGPQSKRRPNRAPDDTARTRRRLRPGTNLHQPHRKWQTEPNHRSRPENSQRPRHPPQRPPSQP